MFGSMALAKWQKRMRDKIEDRQKAAAEARRKKRNERNRWKDREVSIMVSPGRVDGAQGALVARPTAPKQGDPLNQVEFKRGKMLLFSDGSFRTPGRRRFLVSKDGQVSSLSGRQLRKLRKSVRRNAKTATAQALHNSPS